MMNFRWKLCQNQYATLNIALLQNFIFHFLCYILLMSNQRYTYTHTTQLSLKSPTGGNAMQFQYCIRKTFTIPE